MKYKWNDVPDWVNYQTTDENGERWGFEEEPKPDGEDKTWYADEGRFFLLEGLGFNWKQTLEKRPSDG